MTPRADRAGAHRLHIRDIALCAAVAGTVSGLPSTLWSAAAGRSVLEATRAAGTLLPGRRDRPGLAAGALAHVTISTFWTANLATMTAHRRLGALEGAGLGLAIATVDLALIGRRYPAITALPQIPQWLDHLAFGAVAVTALARVSPERSAHPPVAHELI